jgi:type VI protein secretion system component Hcp
MRKRMAVKALLAQSMRGRLLAAMVAAAAVAPMPAMAALEAFMKIDTLEGDAAASAYAGWSQVASYQLGFGGPAVNPPKAAGCTALAITKLLDKSTPKLLAATFMAQHFAMAQVDLVRDGALLARYQFSDVAISGVEDVRPEEGDSPLERLWVSYGRVTVTYYPATGAASAAATSTRLTPITTTIDCARGVAR